jgi:hypothetical protein
VKRKNCSQDGCSNKVKQGGVCVQHGARVKRKNCSQDGCDKQVVKAESVSGMGRNADAKMSFGLHSLSVDILWDY